MQKKIILSQEVAEAINYLYKVAECYFGAINAQNTYQPKLDLINRSVVDDVPALEEKKQEIVT